MKTLPLTGTTFSLSGHIPGMNSLAITNPELAKQAHGWDPTTVAAMSNKKRERICDEQRRYT